MSQQVQCQWQAGYSVDTGNHIVNKHNFKSRINYRKVLEENTLMENSKQTKLRGNKNYVTQNIRLWKNNINSFRLMNISVFERNGAD
jgi:hypothetical protein